MAEIKTGVPYKATKTITPKRLGVGLLGEKVVIDQNNRAWAFNLFDSWEQVEDRGAKRRKAAAQMLYDFADDADYFNVDEAWEVLFDDEATGEDVEAVIEIAKEEMATNLLNAEGLGDDGDDD